MKKDFLIFAYDGIIYDECGNVWERGKKWEKEKGKQRKNRAKNSRRK